MKKLLALLLLLAAPAALATTLTGTIKDAGGNPITGTLWLELSQTVNVNSGGGCGGPYTIGPNNPVTFTLTNGVITGPGGGPYSVVGNDCATPSTSFYKLTAINTSGTFALRKNVSITGASVDIGTLPAAGGGGGTIPSGTTLSGDVTGTTNATVVSRLQGVSVSATPPTSGYSLVYNGSAWAPTLLSTLPASLSSSTASQALLLDGSVGTPSLGFSNDSTTGLYRSGSGIMDFSATGVKSVEFSVLGATVSSGAYFGWMYDTYLARRAANNVSLGGPDSSVPTAFTLSTQGSRSGVDTNVGGANLTIQSGIGTGTGTNSSLIFKVPTQVASGTGAQSADTALTLTGGAAGTTPQVLVPDGSAAAPSYSFSGATNLGFYRIGNSILAGVVGAPAIAIGYNSGTDVNLRADGILAWTAGNPDGAPTLSLTRRAAATLNLGAADAASPVAQTISFQGARGATDTNTAAVAATVQGSLGTGTGASGDIVFKVGTAQASGTTQHVANTVLTLSDAGTSGTAQPQLKPVGAFRTSGTAPTPTGSGFGTGASYAADTGSSPWAGIITATCGTTAGTSGTLTLTFNAVGSNAPACLVTLAQGSTNWNARATAFVQSSSTTTCVFAWDNNAGTVCTSSNTVKFHYLIINK